MSADQWSAAGPARQEALRRWTHRHDTWQRTDPLLNEGPEGREVRTLPAGGRGQRPCEQQMLAFLVHFEDGSEVELDMGESVSLA